MKIKPRELLRWVFIPLLASCLLAWFATPAYSAKTLELKAPEHAQAANSKADTSADMQEAKKLLDELQAREREDYTLVLEGQRKTMDWWFGFLAIVTAVLAIFGALIPYLMGRKDRELIAQDKALVEQDKAQIGKMLGDAKAALDEAKATVAQIHQHETEAKQRAEALKMYQSGQPDGNPEEIKETVAAIQNDPTSDTKLRLRAEAIAADETGQADKAYSLWRALIEFDATDAITHFNAGYWAYVLGKKLQGSESIHWLKQAGQHYAKTLSIEPDMHVAAHNWGAALVHEANILAPTDSRQAHLLLDRAEQLLLQHAEAAPDEVAYNLACVYGVRGDVALCLHWLKTSQTHKTLPDCNILKSDPDLNSIRTSPEFIEWLKTVCPQDQ